jgi:hypothetical protein
MVVIFLEKHILASPRLHWAGEPAAAAVNIHNAFSFTENEIYKLIFLEVNYI